MRKAATAAVCELAGRLTALSGLAVLAPLVLTFLAARALRGEARAGAGGPPFVSALWSVVAGRLALVGPRPRTAEEVARGGERLREVLAVKPGLVCSWWVQRRRGIAYGSELDADLAYARCRGPLVDAALLAKAAAAALTGAGTPSADRRCRILGVSTDNLSMHEAVERIATLAGSTLVSQVCFVNADCLNAACRDHAYREALAGARLVLPDGVGVLLASRLAGASIRENVNGTDLFPRLCARLARDGRRVFLLGARPGVAEKVRDGMVAAHPGLAVVGVQHGYFTAAEEPGVIEAVRGARADVLLVAMGAPRQDLWIRAHLHRLGVRVALGVGGLFDFQSGAVPRAPLWMREIGMEWAFRLLTEPRRLWKRYLVGNVLFLARVAGEGLHLVRYADDGPLIAG